MHSFKKKNHREIKGDHLTTLFWGKASKFRLTVSSSSTFVYFYLDMESIVIQCEHLNCITVLGTYGECSFISYIIRIWNNWKQCWPLLRPSSSELDHVRKGGSEAAACPGDGKVGKTHCAWSTLFSLRSALCESSQQEEHLNWFSLKNLT